MRIAPLALVRPLALVLVLTLVFVACDGEAATEVETPGPEEAPGPLGRGGPLTEASELRADLVSLMEGSVHLAGSWLRLGLHDGWEQEETRGAKSALDEITEKLGERFGEVYGRAEQRRVEELWGVHHEFFANYAQGRAADADELVEQARATLDGFTVGLAEYMQTMTTEIDVGALEDALRGHVDRVVAAIDGFLREDVGTGTGFAELEEAAAFTGEHVASPIAVAVAAVKERDVPGDAGSPSADLRAALAHLVGSHVHLMGLAAEVFTSAGPQSEAARAVLEEVERNARELAEVLGRFLADADSDRFGELWLAHDHAMLQFALGVGRGGDGVRSDVRETFERFQDGVAELLSEAFPALRAAAFREALEDHVEEVRRATTRLVTGDAAGWAELLKAAEHAELDLARPLTAAIALAAPAQLG